MDLRLAESKATALLREVAGAGVTGGVRLARAGEWNDGDERVVALGNGEVLRLSHDEREAPYVLGTDGREDRTTLVSLSDEDVLAACAWVRPPQESDVVGIGIDLANPTDFAGVRGERFNRLIFSVREQELAPALAKDPAMGFAYVFSAKEAAFKACAAPLRRWYESHDEELAFDITQFELCDPLAVRGTLRRGKAEEALRAMGIGIRLGRGRLQDLACTIAVAQRMARGD